MNDIGVICILDGSTGIMCAVIAALLVLSAFFSASETAYSTVNKLRLRKRAEEDGDKGAKSALRIADNYDKTLFSILIGNNIVNIAMSAMATVVATALLGPTGAVVSTVVITVLVLVFGEILPKTYASDNSERVAVSNARPLWLATKLLAPLSAFFTLLKRLLYKFLPQPAGGPVVTEEELIYMIGSIKEDVLEEQERELVQSALEFDEVTVHEILTPRVNMVALDVDSTPEEIRRTVVEEGYSRIPVFEENIDNIIGVLYTKDYYNTLVCGAPFDLRASLGKPLFVRRRLKLSQLLTLFKARKVNLAVVTDDYGGTLGIVTMEDVLEELVGDIYDEDDEIPKGLVRLDDTTVEVAGDQRLDKMFEALGLDKDDVDTDYTTVNGWALHLFEHIPEVEEYCAKAGFVLVVLEMNGHRIKRLRVARRPQAEEQEGD